MTFEWTDLEDVCLTGSLQSSPATATESNAGDAVSEYTSIPVLSPRNLQSTQSRGPKGATNTSCIATEPARGHFEQSPETISSGYSSLASDSESSDWHVISPHHTDAVYSAESPKSNDSPWSHIDSLPTSPTPLQQHAEAHSHVFSARTGDTKSTTTTRGRHRALTTQQRQEALKVRMAKACWSCHISKIKVFISKPGPWK